MVPQPIIVDSQDSGVAGYDVENVLTDTGCDKLPINYWLGTYFIIDLKAIRTFRSVAIRNIFHRAYRDQLREKKINFLVY